FFSSRRRHTRWPRDWSSDVCSSDLEDYKLVNAILTGIGIRSPAVFAAIQRGRVPELANPDTAADTARDSLNDVLGHIRDAYQKRSEERRVGKECRRQRWPEE